MSGKLIIISAPSGAGKSTILKSILKNKDLNLEFSISACNRKPRKGEINGKHYYFISTEEFKQKIANNEFVEWEEVYENNFYGTLHSEVDRILNKNTNVIFDIDVEGGLNIKKLFGDKALAIFIMPPSIEKLRERLEHRNTDNQDEINRRVSKARKEISKSHFFDKIIVNNDLDTAVKKTYNVIKNFIKN